jgi:hypothetical protein
VLQQDRLELVQELGLVQLLEPSEAASLVSSRKWLADEIPGECRKGVGVVFSGATSKRRCRCPGAIY